MNDERHTERAEVFAQLGERAAAIIATPKAVAWNTVPLVSARWVAFPGLKRMTLIGLFTGGPV